MTDETASRSAIEEPMGRTELSARLRALGRFKNPEILGTEEDRPWRTACLQAADFFDKLNELGLDAAPPSSIAAPELAAKQAEIDRLMLEFCPDEMTEEQKANWAAHQQPAGPEAEAAIEGAIRSSTPPAISSPNEHPETAQCGFDRDASHSENTYVCNCGWRDEGMTEAQKAAYWFDLYLEETTKRRALEAKSSSTTSPKKVLVVDDGDSMSREAMLRLIAEEEGKEVQMAQPSTGRAQEPDAMTAAQVRQQVIQAAYRPGPMCRDCGDRDGTCYDGKKCDPFEAALDMLRAHASPSTVSDGVTVSRSLAERTEAMFRSVDPWGSIAQEWKQALSSASVAREEKPGSGSIQ